MRKIFSYRQAFSRIDTQPQTGRAEIKRGGDPEDRIKRTENAFHGGGRQGREHAGDAGADVYEAASSAAEAAAHVRGGGPHDGKRQIVRAAREREERNGGSGRFHVNSREIADGPDRISHDGHGSAAHHQTAPTPGDEIRENTAQDATYRARSEWKRREYAGLGERESVLLNQVSWQPGDKELKAETGSEVTRKQRQHRPVGQ